ncbi:MAG: hypothetical protein ACLP1Y_09040 [Candidatus Acidiferrales bacterium]
MGQIITGSTNPTLKGTIPLEWWREVTTNYFLAQPVAARCCGRMSAWFVNRDGRTLCWTCDDERQIRLGRERRDSRTA